MLHGALKAPLQSPLQSPLRSTLGVLASGAASPYAAESNTLFAAMSVQPDATRKGHYDTLITSLKTAGVWTKLDLLYVMAAHDAQAARLNLKNPGTNTAAMAAAFTGAVPTFTADRGYTGDAVGGYGTTGFNPSTAGGNYARDSAHQGVWIGTDATSTLMMDFGHLHARINSRNATSAGLRANSSNGNNVSMSLTTSIGWTCWSRSTGANYDAVRNLETPVNTAEASMALFNGQLYLFTYDPTISTNFSSRRLQAAHVGSGLNDTERDAFYNALNTYMTAVGAV